MNYFDFIKRNTISIVALVVAVVSVIWAQASVSVATRQLEEAQKDARREAVGLFEKADSGIERVDGEIAGLVKEGFVERDDFGKIAARVAAATVLITSSKDVQKLSEAGSLVTEKSNNPEGSLGTGFFVDSKGVIATAKHVVDGIGKDDLFVRTSQGKTQKAEFVASDEKTDITLISIARGEYPSVELGYFENLETGEEVGFVGFTGNSVAVGSLISRGVVSSKGTGENGVKSFTVNAFVNKGNSGAPVFSAVTGRVVGVLSARQRDISADRFINLPANYQAGFMLGGIDPLKLNVDLYNQTLKIVGDISQVGIGVVHSADGIKTLLER